MGWRKVLSRDWMKQVCRKQKAVGIVEQRDRPKDEALENFKP